MLATLSRITRSYCILGVTAASSSNLGLNGSMLLQIVASDDKDLLCQSQDGMKGAFCGNHDWFYAIRRLITSIVLGVFIQGVPTAHPG